MDPEKSSTRCIVVAFGLEKRDSNSILYTYQPRVISHGEGIDEVHLETAVADVAKFQYLARSYETSETPIYFSVIGF